MKKIISLLISICLVSVLTLTTLANSSTVRVSKDNIVLSNTQSTCEVVVEIEPEGNYAGIEIGVSCPEGVSLTSSSGSSGSMSASPVFANGLYWTSFFESSNNLSGGMEITLQFSCPQTFNSGDISIQEVKVFTKNGAGVDTEKLTPSLKVHVTRTGSDEESEITSSSPSDSESTTSNISENLENSNVSSINENSNTHANSSNVSEETVPSTGDNNLFCYILLLMFGISIVGAVIFASKKVK